MGGGSIAIISRSSCMCWAVSRVAVVRVLLVSLVMSSWILTMSLKGPVTRRIYVGGGPSTGGKLLALQKRGL